MNNPPDLRVDRSLALLQQLQQTSEEFAKREEQLAREFRTRRLAVDRQRAEAVTKQDAADAEELERLEASLHEEENRIRTIHANRTARIQRVHTNEVRNAINEGQKKKDKWLADLQLKHLKLKKALPIDLKAIDTEYGDLTVRLADDRSRLASMENSARSAFGGYGSFSKLLVRVNEEPTSVPNPVERDAWFASLAAQLDDAEQKLAAFRQFPLPRIFSMLPLAVMLPMVAVIGGVGVYAVRSNPTLLAISAGVLVVVLIGISILHRIGHRQAEPLARALADAINLAVKTKDACAGVAQVRHEGDRQRINDTFNAVCAELQEKWDQADDVEMDLARATRQSLEKKLPRATARNERLLKLKLSRVAPLRTERLEQTRELIRARRTQLDTTHQAAAAAITDEQDARFRELEAAWNTAIGSVYAEIDAMRTAPTSTVAQWDTAFVENWSPSNGFPPAVKFGDLNADLAREGAVRPKQLALPGPSNVSIPLSLAFPAQGSLLFEVRDSSDATITGTINNVVLRLLASTPPGKITFTIIDPVGLGQNFAGLMHLSDYEESIINRRIWTQRDQIEERLAELNEHIEKVIQMYLRTEFATITEYNAQAGSVAEKIHFLVIADFPSTFSETAAKRLQSIALSGPRCGVFTLIHWDPRQPDPDGFVSDELRKNAVCIRRDNGAFTLSPEQRASGATLHFDAPPEAAIGSELVHKIGKSSIDSNRVEVPFSHIAPKPDDRWTNETTQELRIPIGRTGATKLQYLAIGKGTRQHALFAGKTGSGKSTLFHVIITNLALACSPDQVEFYLIDFKKGVEFKCYASNRLPHARVVAIESDREFGLSVLQRVDEELKRRGDLFRKLGVQDVAGFKKAGGAEPMPRTLLIIDEFQEFFVEDDEIAQNASLLFDRIVRQGRAFGIHVLLGSQTLGGAYTLARATLGQMAVRVALQCNEADAYLIMDDNNAAPRLLSRPGEGIYNDAAGAVEGNSPFQVVWLPDDERDTLLGNVRGLAEKHHIERPGPIVFEGNAPADIRENFLLQRALEPVTDAPVPVVGRCWLGAPNSIKGPTEAVFQRQSGNHLLIVGQREEAALTLLGVSLLSLAAQYPVGKAKFVFFHQANPGSPEAAFLDPIFAAIPHGVAIAQGSNLAEVMNDLAADLKERSTEGATEAPAVFVFIHGLQRFKKLRQEDEFSFSTSDSDSASNPGAQFANLITEGSSHGMHLIAAVDSFNNVNRFLSRKVLSEIEMRVVFQMSANDSASLIDSPKASALGLHRAILYNEQQGSLETFRPYALPTAEWIAEASAKLAQRRV